MPTLDLDTFLGVIFNNTNMQAVYYNNTMIWPKTHSYSLKNVVVNYSNSNSISPSCNDYAWLTATLVDTYLGQSTETTVTLSPVIKSANDLYAISGTQVRANSSKKKTEYSQQTTQFSGTYTINGETISPSAGVTASSVLLTANVKTTTPASQQTTKYEIYVSETDILGTGGTSTVSGTRTYNSTSVRYDWTSGEHEGGDTSTGLKEYNEAATSCRVNPTTGATCSGNTITFATNNNTSARSYNVYGTYDGVESTNECTITQYANSYAYSTVSVSIAYPLIDASGGTVTPEVSYSQTYGWYPSTTGVGTVTSGGTITYYVEEEVSSNGAVSANSLGTSRRTTNTKIAEECYAVVSLNGKGGESSHISVYQTTNDIEETTAVVSVLFSGMAQTTYTFGPQSQNVSFSAQSVRTHTWTSRAQSTETVGTSALSVTKSGTWYTVSNWVFDVNENTSNYERSGYITVKDNTYGSQRVDLTQEKVAYEFTPYAPPMESFSIGYNDVYFTIAVVSTRNWKGYSFTTSRVSISGSTIGNLRCYGITQSDLDPTVYVATFTCSTNSATSTKSATIKFTQPSSNKTITYTVQQEHYVPASITTSVEYITIATSGGYGSFTVTANRNWNIDENFKLCDFNGDSLGSDSAALSLSLLSGGTGTTTVSVNRGSYTQNSIVDIKITCDTAVVHVIVAPTLTISRSVSSWSAPADASTKNGVITTTYPDISWSTTENWLTGSGTSISVSQNSNYSTRSASATATGSISGTYFGVSYTASGSASSISVSQAAAAAPNIECYISIDEQDPETAYLCNVSDGSLITAPQRIIIRDIKVYDGQGHQVYNGYGQINQGSRDGTITWDEGVPYDIGVIDQAGEALWLGTIPSGYTLHSLVIWNH